MRFSALARALVCFGCAPSPNAREQALVAEAERRVQLPKGAGPLRCYRRYYTVLRGRQMDEMLGFPGQQHFRELLVGTYREPEEGEAPGIEWVGNLEDVPDMHDGGCWDMTVVYAEEMPGEVVASCALDISGDQPEEVGGRPLTC